MWMLSNWEHKKVSCMVGSPMPPVTWRFGACTCKITVYCNNPNESTVLWEAWLFVDTRYGQARKGLTSALLDCLTEKKLLTDVSPDFDDQDTDLFLCDTNTCKFDGECLRIGNMVTCICDFKVRSTMFLFFCFTTSFILRYFYWIPPLQWK